MSKVDAGARFDLAIIDVMMPGTSGYDLCRELRSRFDAAELPVILLTARTQMQDLLEGFNVGASDYLHKPFSKRELRARVEAHRVADIAKGFRAPELSQRFSDQGFENVLGTPEQTSAFFKEEIERWAKVVKASGAQVD